MRDRYLHRCDGSLLGGGDALLHGTHVSGQGRLVAYSRRNTTQQGGYFGTSLSETENVVNKEQYVLTLLITEIFSNGQTSQSNTGTSAWGFVHLTVYKCDL